MLNNRLKQAFLVLLRQGLWGRKEVETNLFPLTPDEWMQIYEMAVKQTVQGIVYDGIQLLPKEQQPPRGILIQWTVAIDQLERMNRQQNVLLEVLPRLFGQEPAIPYQVLKGQGIAAFYPNPLHRLCGDIDLYFGNEEQTEKANQRIETVGIPVERGRNGESNYMLNGVLIEHHAHLIDLHYNKKQLQQWEAQRFQQGGQTPDAVANHLLLSTHILKHLVNEGIGLRQLCDAAMALVGLAEQTDKKELEQISRQWHIYRWHQLLYALLVKHIGMPEEYLPFPTHVKPDRLMDEVWESGNFGHGDERFGNRPEGKWKSKWHTWKIVTNKLHLSAVYAPHETWHWLTGLIGLRIKELFTHESN